MPYKVFHHFVSNEESIRQWANNEFAGKHYDKDSGKFPGHTPFVAKNKGEQIRPCKQYYQCWNNGNHDLYDNRKHVVKDVCIGKYCWIGMNSIILPGTSLGDYTIVAAGSVVTKSFTSGYCVIGGNPAKVLKELDKEQVVFHTSPYEYNGYIQSSQFENYRKTYLNV